MNHNPKSVTRREFIQAGAAASVGVCGTPLVLRAANQRQAKRTRQLGRTGFEVTTMGLGGQASLQWTPKEVDPVAIIVDAYRRGVNYFDTSNVYADSQRNYGKAFRKLGLVPGLPNYQEAQRGRVFVASKTMLRMAKGSLPPGRHVNATQGPRGSLVIDDLKRTLSQIFGDQRGEYADDAYLDLYQIHNLNHMREVDTIFLGLDKPDAAAEQIGALAALRDYRDGTNLTGLNPREERRIRHLGITGHISSPVLMECIQRDEEQLLDTLLVAINANDRLYFNHQYNVIPVAAAKGMGLIAMKVFADGAMFGREPGWTHLKPEVVRTVGSDQLRSAPLVHYALSVPGISTAIIGIGHIDKAPLRCQLQQNLAAAQLEAPLADGDMQRVEQMTASIRDGRTNYFQLAAEPLGAPRDATAKQLVRDGNRRVRLSWHTAFAFDAPITQYLVQRDGQQITRVSHEPQLTKKPFSYEDAPQDRDAHAYTVVAVDMKGRTAKTNPLQVAAMG